LENILAQKSLTTIIIAHRLSTIRTADKIHVIVGGSVKEQGTHEELMSYKSYYRQLVEKQEGADCDSNGRGKEEINSEQGKSDLSAATEGVDMVAAMSSSGITPELEFRKLKFAYPSRPRKIILNDFDLTIEKGRTVALV